MREETKREITENLKLIGYTDAEIAEIIEATEQHNRRCAERQTLDEPEAEMRVGIPTASAWRQQDETLKETMTIAEAAAYLRISIDALYNRIERIQIPAFWSANHWRLEKSRL